MRFSLIVATVGRVTELQAFLDSLRRQQERDFEVIIVDQNGDDRLAPVLGQFASVMPIKRLRLEMRNSSYARNAGLAEATGEIIAFPDDDCLYPDGTLEYVDAWFRKDPGLSVLAGPAISPAGALGSGRWHKTSGEPDMRTIWTSIIEFNMFMKSSSVRAVGGFDEELGVGAPFGSGEGVDLAIRIKNRGERLFYDFNLCVIHPDKALSKTAAVRAYRYGRGLGRVLRKHAKETGTPTILTFAVRPFGGMVLSLMRANMLGTEYYLRTLLGRVSGFGARL